MGIAGDTRQKNHADQFADLWQTTQSPPDVFAFVAEIQNLSGEDLIDICKVDQICRWRAAIELPVEKYAECLPVVASDKRLKLSLIQNEVQVARDRGQSVLFEELVRRFPEMADIPRDVLIPVEKMTIEDVDSQSFQPNSPTHLVGRDSSKLIAADSGRSATSSDLDQTAPYPEYMGRYRIQRVLGDGGFGRVYLAFDDVLTRNVAIKVPHRHLVAKASDVQSYLKEARILSSLEHPAIIPVYDFGELQDGRCFVVSKWIDGSDLSSRLKRAPYSNAATAELIAIVADALHFAHLKGVVHRDVKPANILIDSIGRPYLADFGIALRDEDIGTGHSRIGTVTYMSPEQIRGEGHLVDGRSDIFSLGIVLYEMLTGKRPFPRNRLNHSTVLEPRPLRQIDDSISKELERICLKALSHRVIDRYNTAIDMAADLRQYLLSANQVPTAIVAGFSGSSKHTSNSHSAPGTAIQIVPKGLRSFDRDDASFFLELLPGARGRDGLPESVRFWKNRILGMESDPFRVAVIYGSSGSGKSSFLKAGVLPQVAGEVVPIYVEATPSETESRLLKALRKAFPELSPNAGLAESLAILRRQNGSGTGRRILIVIDQFEQWLHGNSQTRPNDLQVALRQCDGENLLCIITVRDDFWMAVTQFMDELEVSLIPGDNLAAIELFSVRHARKVLIAIGQAYGILSANAQEITVEQRAFVEHSVVDLSRNDQVIPVQLALFAEMVKDKDWSLATLKSIGGTEGVGVTFLEETFHGHTANPNHRLHQKAARKVLQALLSEGASGIKGSMRSYSDLQQISGYADQPRDFEALLRILDSELRLITPTDPDGLDPDGNRTDSSHCSRERYYHLTHDYLVPSLKEWLTRKRRETRRGRAELLLADHATAWNQRKSNRSLPTFFEWISILAFAGRRVRSENQAILAASRRYYGTRAIVVVGVLGIALWGVSRRIDQLRATSIVELLSRARSRDVPAVVGTLTPYRANARPILKHLAKESDSPAAKLHANMALLRDEQSYQSEVYDGLINAAAEDLNAICEYLFQYADRPKIRKWLWAELHDTARPVEKRLRAGAALAKFDPCDSDRLSEDWQKSARFLADSLVREIGANLGDFNPWVAAFKPARDALTPELRGIFANANANVADVDRYTAAMVLADFSEDRPAMLASLILMARPKEYSVLAPKLRTLGERGADALRAEFSKSVSDETTAESRNELERRKAYAAVSLIEFDVIDPLISVLSAPVDSMLASYAEDRLSSLGLRPQTLYRISDGATTEVQAALLRSLAGMKRDQFSPEFCNILFPAVIKVFQNDPDPGLHSAAEWALRSWELTEKVSELKKAMVNSGPSDNRRWYVNSQGQTMIVLKGPIEAVLGSPPDESGRDSDEAIHTRIINREIAVCSTEVSREQFLRYLPDFRHKKKDYSPTPDCPITLMTWYRAAEYCNWLSEKDGIPAEQFCYVPTINFVKTTRRPEGEEFLGMKLKPNGLSLAGYRLLTESEWEYACRAGARTAYSWGNDPSLSPRYARSLSLQGAQHLPIGSLCPNRFGFFDMHGNASEWTQDIFVEVARSSGIDDESDVAAEFDDQRTVRGGNSQELVPYLRAANRSGNASFWGVSPRVGFRIARTLAVRTTKD